MSEKLAAADAPTRPPDLPCEHNWVVHMIERPGGNWTPGVQRCSKCRAFLGNTTLTTTPYGFHDLTVNLPLEDLTRKLKAAEDQITALAQSLAHEQHLNRLMMVDEESAHQRAEAFAEQITALRAYVQHKHECDTMFSRTPGGWYLKSSICSCGLDTLLSRVPEKAP